MKLLFPKFALMQVKIPLNIRLFSWIRKYFEYINAFLAIFLYLVLFWHGIVVMNIQEILYDWMVSGMDLS